MGCFAPLARLPLTVQSYRLEGLSQQVARFRRRTTVVRLSGAGKEGLGEDVTYEAEDQLAFQQAGPRLVVEGQFTLEAFSARLTELELFERPPARPASRDFRRWAFESAALDLALRQAGLSLGAALGRELAPVRFVVSLGLGRPPSLERLRQLRGRDGSLRFKLDTNPGWSEGLIAELAAAAAVDVVDFKGAYHGTPVDQPPDVALYSRVAAGLPAVWLEDPALTAETEAALAPYRDRVTWDAPLHSVDDIRRLGVSPRCINMKPSRFATVRALCDAYDYCAEHGIRIYGGGQFELGPGRAQVQHLAALFHSDAPNDVAPTGYNLPDLPAELARSPLQPLPEAPGFRAAVATVAP